MNELPTPSSGAAWFFDFDGTLIPIAPLPDRVAPPAGLSSLLARLHSLRVALAVATKRSTAEQWEA
jgi:trehalose-6-phosphatase